jgi:bifunctional DNA-binding transcriptional regulator/antitoxin component of YhaV-PrlF toxin-antitoxin module
MEITKLSSKGQIVIPEKLRRGVDVGTSFMVTRQNDLIVLKKVEGFTEKEKIEMKELDSIWKDIDEGKCETYTEKEFFEKLKEW